MAIINTTSLISYIDGLVRIYLQARGADPTHPYAPSNPSGFGLGIDNTWGASQHIIDILDAVASAVTISGIDGLDVVNDLATQVESLSSKLVTSVFASGFLSSPLGALQSHVTSNSTATSLDKYLTSLNTAGPSFWQALMPSAYGAMYNDIYGARPAINNLWWEVLQGAQYPQALGSLNAATTTFSAGYDISSANLYAGGFPYVNGVGIVGTGAITVTGTAFDPASKGFVPGVTWAYNLLSAVDGEYALAPSGVSAAPANSLIATVMAITVANTITAGNFYIEAHRPIGRDVFNY